jgi:hypothetical protein
MSAAKHTPGPWRFALFEHEPNEAFVQWQAGFAAVHGSRAGREANAHLIAAAPDLLQALLNLVGTLCAADGSNMEADLDAIDARVTDARAAIVKATGDPQ